MSLLNVCDVKNTFAGVPQSYTEALRLYVIITSGGVLCIKTFKHTIPLAL